VVAAAVVAVYVSVCLYVYVGKFVCLFETGPNGQNRYGAKRIFLATDDQKVLDDLERDAKTNYSNW
jgi:hypothetical protein